MGKLAHDLHGQFTEEEIQVTDDYMKCFQSH